MSNSITITITINVIKVIFHFFIKSVKPLTKVTIYHQHYIHIEHALICPHQQCDEWISWTIILSRLVIMEMASDVTPQVKQHHSTSEITIILNNMIYISYIEHNSWKLFL